MFDWIGQHKTLMWTLGAASLVILVASMILVPALVVRIPPDYFSGRKRPEPWAKMSPAVRWTIVIGKNVLGVVLVLAGIAMFLLPGQGLLTLLVGIFLVDFPGKFKFEKWLLTRRYILRPINWLRKRRGREPLQAPTKTQKK